MKYLLARFLAAKEGQALSEYALILALVAVVVVGAVITFGEQIQGVFENITASLGGGV